MARVRGILFQELRRLPLGRKYICAPRQNRGENRGKGIEIKNDSQGERMVKNVYENKPYKKVYRQIDGWSDTDQANIKVQLK